MELSSTQSLLNESSCRAAERIKGNLTGELVLEHPFSYFADDHRVKLLGSGSVRPKCFFEGLEEYLVVSVFCERLENCLDLFICEVALQLGDDATEAVEVERLASHSYLEDLVKVLLRGVDDVSEAASQFHGHGLGLLAGEAAVLGGGLARPDVPV